MAGLKGPCRVAISALYPESGAYGKTACNLATTLQVSKSMRTEPQETAHFNLCLGNAAHSRSRMASTFSAAPKFQKSRRLGNPTAGGKWTAGNKPAMEASGVEPESSALTGRCSTDRCFSGALELCPPNAADEGEGRFQFLNPNAGSNGPRSSCTILTPWRESGPRLLSGPKNPRRPAASSQVGGRRERRNEVGEPRSRPVTHRQRDNTLSYSQCQLQSS